MLAKKYTDAVATPLSPITVTEKTKDYIIKHPLMHRGSVRVFIGKISTDKNYERKRRKVLSKKWP